VGVRCTRLDRWHRSTRTPRRRLEPRTTTDGLVGRAVRFTIIVLGEVVFGVLDGISASERDTKTITTGIVALIIGSGFWWIYFDLVGRRLSRPSAVALATWRLSHLPITRSPQPARRE
jgi:low temperature requirement protein LtrA